MTGRAREEEEQAVQAQKLAAKENLEAIEAEQEAVRARQSEALAKQQADKEAQVMQAIPLW